MKKLLLLSLTASLSTSAFALTINPNITGTQLAQSIDGSGITIDYSSVNYVGAQGQAAQFTNGSSVGLEINKGIMLTTGLAKNALGPNNVGNKSSILGTPGDADLNAINSQSSNTYDANVLEFKFTSNTGKLFFRFSLASEEYNEFLNYPDVFGLFVNGKNIAKAPDGQELSIGTVNCGESGTDTSGPNCAYFINNTDAKYNIQYDGFTKSFLAEVSGLGTGVHTMKFAIADANDAQLDSAIFIQADSFSSEEPPSEVPVPAAVWLFGSALLGLNSLRKKR